MSWNLDDFRLEFEQTREGELYRERKRLEREKRDAEYTRRNEDYEREQAERHAREKRRIECEAQAERYMYLSNLIDERNEEIEFLELRMRFGIEEMDE